MQRGQELLHRELSETIIGAAMAVLNTLGPGLDEKIYENSLILELIERGALAQQQQKFPVHYKGRFVGRLIPDLIVDEKIIVEAKVVQGFDEHMVAQVLSYLSITKLELGLLINFNYATLKWQRVVRSRAE